MFFFLTGISKQLATWLSHLLAMARPHQALMKDARFTFHYSSSQFIWHCGLSFLITS